MNNVVLDKQQQPAPDTVIFDIGGVLIDWNPRHLYRQLFDDDTAMERFLAEVCSPEWNEPSQRTLRVRSSAMDE